MATSLLLTEQQALKHIVQRHSKLENAAVRHYKIKMKDKLVFVWAIALNMDECYLATDVFCNEIRFMESDIVTWLPYNGEKLPPYLQIRFDRGGNLYLEIIPITTKDEARSIINAAYKRAYGAVSLMDATPNTDHRDIADTAGPYWTMRHGDYNYAGVSCKTRQTVFIYHRESRRTYAVGETLPGNFVLKEEKGKLVLAEK